MILNPILNVYLEDVSGMTIIDCIRKYLVEGLAEVLNTNVDEVETFFNEGKLKFARTPDPNLGDYGLALHPILHKYSIPRDKWIEFYSVLRDKMISKGLISECYVFKMDFVNGYLNIFIDYNRLFKTIIDKYVTGEYSSELRSIGRGEKVIVEHTSANPVHPLHIGSGRNSVLGNTYARLLRYLGFNVREHFYVDDMGRQVATLVYGYKILRKHGVDVNPDLKTDHWFGAVYAITNVIIEKKRLLREVFRLERRLEELTRELEQFVNQLNEKYGNYYTLDALITIKRSINEFKLIHRKQRLMATIIKKLKRLTEINVDENDSKRLFEYINQLESFIKNYRGFTRELREFSFAEARLASKYPVLYRVLNSEIDDPDEAEDEIEDLMRRYESGDEEVKELFNNVVNSVLNGFKDTLSKLGITFDSFDWESSSVVRRYLEDFLKRLDGCEYAVKDGYALIVDLDKAARDHQYIADLFKPDTPGKVVVRRSDGTTLYVTRDVAYSIMKIRDYNADRVYNVIATEQTREQKQVKALLHLAGYRDIAERIIHFKYEMVNLKGMRMSGRRGVYYTLDELIEDYIDVLAHKYIENQLKLGRLKPELDENTLRDSFMKLSIASTRALLLSVEPSKVLVFNPSKLGDYDTGAWILYTFARLQSILRKAYDIEPLDELDKLHVILNDIKTYLQDKELSFNIEEKSILETIMDFKNTLVKAYVEMDPSKILEHTRRLCTGLNQFYEKHPVIREDDPVKRNTRLALIIISLLVLKDLLYILGFPVIKRI